MKNYRLTVDLQMDSNETATAFAQALQVTMQVAARSTIDICDHDSARVVLGKTQLRNADSFTPNREAA